MHCHGFVSSATCTAPGAGAAFGMQAVGLTRVSWTLAATTPIITRIDAVATTQGTAGHCEVIVVMSPYVSVDQYKVRYHTPKHLTYNMLVQHMNPGFNS